MENYREILRREREREENIKAREHALRSSEPPTVRPEELEFMEKYNIRQILEDVNIKEWDSMGATTLINENVWISSQRNPVFPNMGGGGNYRGRFGYTLSYSWLSSYRDRYSPYEGGGWNKIVNGQASTSMSISFENDTIVFTSEIINPKGLSDRTDLQHLILREFDHRFFSEPGAQRTYERILYAVAEDCETRERRGLKPQTLQHKSFFN